MLRALSFLGQKFFFLICPKNIFLQIKDEKIKKIRDVHSGETLKQNKKKYIGRYAPAKL